MRLKDLHKKNLVKAEKIIVDSIMDHLIPKVSSLKTPKEKRRWEQLKIKISRFKEDTSSDEEYEELNF